MNLISSTRKLFFKDSKILNPILANANYYPPDISVVKLADQDRQLKNLKLRDFKLFEQLYAQERLIKRGKSIRVHVVDGPKKDFVKKTKSKKK